MEKTLPPPPLPPPPRIQEDHHEHQGRPRAETESSLASESTATPPRFLDAGFDDGGLDLDFGNFGKRRSKLVDDSIAPLTESPVRSSEDSCETVTDRGQPNESPRSPRRLAREYFTQDPAKATPPPPSAPFRDPQFQDPQSSPYSWRSKGSYENLLSTDGAAESKEHNPGFRRQGYEAASPGTPPLLSQSTQINRSDPKRPSLGENRRDSAYASIGGVQHENQGIELLRNSQSVLQGFNRRSMTFDNNQERSYDPRLTAKRPDTGNPSSQATTTTRKAVQLSESVELTPRPKQRFSQAPNEEESLFDQSSLPSAADIKRQHRQDTGTQPKAQNKVMTKAQFDQYQREQERTRKSSGTTKDSADEDSGDDYDDDDDLERDKLAAKQRRKQEAHFAVYRQQMMKVTGETPSDLPNLKTSSTASTLHNRSTTPTLSLNDGPPQRSSDDEDEEVPLGILAAHGFPNKSRPPTAGGPGANVSFRSETYPPPPPSTAGGSRTSTLPAFARKLPQDPYYGAGLVNQANRESLAFGNKSSAPVSSSSFPQQQQQQGTPHPAGLVGVIAGEERARAARRGSANAQGGFGQALPQGMQSPMMDPNNASQQQMAQMTRFMQTQMQFMQQMQAMMAQGMPLSQQSPMPPAHMQLPMAGNGFISPQNAQQQQQMMMMQQNGMLGPNGQIVPRPLSHSAPGSPATVMQGPRSQSMLGSGPMPWGSQQERRASYAPSMMSGALGNGPGPSYTPSIAPSERSNVGMPSRYRPVSIAPSAMGEEVHSNGHRPGSAMSMSMSSNNQLRPASRQLNVPNTLRPVSQLSGGSNPAAKKKQENESDEEEEGWEEMKAKREAKKRERLGKKQGSLLDVYVPTD